MLPKKKKEKYSTKQQAKRICNPRMLSKLTKDRVEKKKEIKKIDRPFQKGKKKKKKKNTLYPETSTASKGRTRRQRTRKD